MELEKLPVIDWDLGLKLTGNKRDLAEELLSMLIKTLPDELNAINGYYLNKNYTELLRQVHRLHGALCYCPLPRLRMIIANIESDLKKNNQDNLAFCLKHLNTEIQTLLHSYPNLA